MRCGADSHWWFARDVGGNGNEKLKLLFQNLPGGMKSHNRPSVIIDCAVLTIQAVFLSSANYDLMEEEGKFIIVIT